jgi:hypothetical protein
MVREGNTLQSLYDKQGCNIDDLCISNTILTSPLEIWKVKAAELEMKLKKLGKKSGEESRQTAS